MPIPSLNDHKYPSQNPVSEKKMLSSGNRVDGSLVYLSTIVVSFPE